jgi:hypothetical protein
MLKDNQQLPIVYKPMGGWNPAFSQKDKTACTELFEHIRPIHGEVIAEMMSQMIMFKRKYHLKYSEEQEQKIAAVIGLKANHSLGMSINPRMVMKNSAV